MVLPGIQTLFGFQLIAVFNAGFAEKLPPEGRLLHLAATVLIACAIALIMAPAAYHRQAERDRVSQYFANYASRMITIAMAPLLAAIAIEVALISYAINQSIWIAVGLGSTLAVLYALLWFAFPWTKARRRSRA
jgi:cobalamin synthase